MDRNPPTTPSDDQPATDELLPAGGVPLQAVRHLYRAYTGDMCEYFTDPDGLVLCGLQEDDPIHTASDEEDVVVDEDGRILTREETTGYTLEGPRWATSFTPNDGSNFTWSRTVGEFSVEGSALGQRPARIELDRTDAVTSRMSSPGRFVGFIDQGPTHVILDVYEGGTLVFDVDQAEHAAEALLEAVRVARGGPPLEVVEHARRVAAIRQADAG